MRPSISNRSKCNSTYTQSGYYVLIASGQGQRKTWNVTEGCKLTTLLALTIICSDEKHSNVLLRSPNRKRPSRTLDEGMRSGPLHVTIRVKWTHAKELKQKGNDFIFTGTYCTCHNLLMLSYSLKHSHRNDRNRRFAHKRSIKFVLVGAMWPYGA